MSVRDRPHGARLFFVMRGFGLDALGDADLPARLKPVDFRQA